MKYWATYDFQNAQQVVVDTTGKIHYKGYFGIGVIIALCLQKRSGEPIDEGRAYKQLTEAGINIMKMLVLKKSWKIGNRCPPSRTNKVITGKETDPTPVMLVNEKLEKVSRWASRRFKQYTGVEVPAETFKKEIIKKIKERS